MVCKGKCGKPGFDYDKAENSMIHEHHQPFFLLILKLEEELGSIPPLNN